MNENEMRLYISQIRKKENGVLREEIRMAE